MAMAQDTMGQHSNLKSTENQQKKITTNQHQTQQLPQVTTGLVYNSRAVLIRIMMIRQLDGKSSEKNGYTSCVL
jgi:hypothetical protein